MGPYAGPRINQNPDAAIPAQSLNHAARSTQQLGGVHKDVLLWVQHRERRKLGTNSVDISDAEPSARSTSHSCTPSARQDSEVEAVPKGPEGSLGGFWGFWHFAG